MIAKVYSDGGCVKENPSPLGGTWAFCHVDESGGCVLQRSGLVLPAETGTGDVTNNFTELYAAVLCLEALPEGWQGVLYTDSENARGRISRGSRKKQKFTNIPAWLIERTVAARERVFCDVLLLGGHPTRAELASGFRKDGKPVSAWNVLCDRLCQQEAHAFLSSRGLLAS